MTLVGENAEVRFSTFVDRGIDRTDHECHLSSAPSCVSKTGVTER